MPPAAPASPRGCLLLVVQSSATMAEPLRALDGKTKAQAACLLGQEVLKKLILAHRTGALSGAGWDVGVVGVGRAADVVSLLQGTRPDAPFVPLETLDLEEVLPLDLPRTEGSEPRTLAHAIQLLHTWGRQHDHTLKPVVVHCTDETGWSNDYPRLVHSLELFRSREGPPVLLTCAFSNAFAGTPRFPLDGSALSNPWKSFWETSTFRKSWGTRAFWINDLPSAHVAEMVEAVSKTTASPQKFTQLAAGYESHALSVPKDGNSDEECEDAFDLDESNGLGVVADGASQGIFVRAWARGLTGCYLASRPDLTDPAQIADWLKVCRVRWKEGIDYGQRHGLEQDKIDRLGANATFLALRLGRMRGKVAWRAFAVGDSCLFWLRGREYRLHASFPLTHSGEFGIAPDLVPSVRQLAPNVRFVTAEGVGKDGDSFALATDAVAQYLLRCYELGQTPTWGRYWDMGRDEWQQEVQRLRQQRLMVNDDSTLVLLRPTE